jgi:excisionase family DNA binding protein
VDEMGGPRGGYPPVLDAAQVAQLLQLNIDYVRKLSREGVLPAHKLPGGRTFRYFREEVLDWLRDQPVGAGDEVAATRRSGVSRDAARGG